MANSKLDGERAVEAFSGMAKIIDDIDERTVGFLAEVSKDDTNMPFMERIKDIVSTMRTSINSTKENTTKVLNSLRDYAEKADIIAEGGDID